MQIFIRNLPHRTITLEVEPSTTVDEVKVKYQDIVGLHADLFRFECAGMQLKDGNTLADYHIEKDSTLFLMCKWPVRPMAKEKTLTEKKIETDIEPKDTVDRRVEENQGIPPGQDRLIYD